MKKIILLFLSLLSINIFSVGKNGSEKYEGEKNHYSLISFGTQRNSSMFNIDANFLYIFSTKEKNQVDDEYLKKRVHKAIKNHNMFEFRTQWNRLVKQDNELITANMVTDMASLIKKYQGIRTIAEDENEAVQKHTEEWYKVYKARQCVIGAGLFAGGVFGGYEGIKEICDADEPLSSKVVLSIMGFCVVPMFLYYGYKNMQHGKKRFLKSELFLDSRKLHAKEIKADVNELYSVSSGKITLSEQDVEYKRWMKN